MPGTQELTISLIRKPRLFCYHTKLRMAILIFDFQYFNFLGWFSYMYHHNDPLFCLTVKNAADATQIEKIWWRLCSTVANAILSHIPAFQHYATQTALDNTQHCSVSLRRTLISEENIRWPFCHIYFSIELHTMIDLKKSRASQPWQFTTCDGARCIDWALVGEIDSDWRLCLVAIFNVQSTCSLCSCVSIVR